MYLESLPNDLAALIARIEDTAHGQDVALVREAIALAQQHELPVWEYRLRVWLNSALMAAGDDDGLLVSFAKTLAIHDSNPEKFPLDAGDGEHLLFQYKWVAEQLNNSPTYSLAQINATYADMERRFRESGHSMSGYLQIRFSSAVDRGEFDEAAKYYTQLQATPSDELSHCEACSRAEAAHYHVERGDSERALELYEEIFSGGLACAEEPEHSEASAMFLHLRRGDVARAKALHYKSLAAVKQNIDPGPMLLAHIEFCVVTGNVARALDLAEQYPSVFRTPLLNGALQFKALTVLALLADALVDAGQGGRTIHGTAAPEVSRLLDVIESRERTATEIAPLAWARAQTIADQFDARNGTAYYNERLERAHTLERIDLPLGFEEFAAPEPEPVSFSEAPTTVLEHVAAIRNALFVDPRRAMELYRAGLKLAVDENSSELVLSVLFVPEGTFPLDCKADIDAALSVLAQMGSPELARVIGQFGPSFVTDFSPETRIEVLKEAQALTEVEPASAARLLLFAAERYGMEEADRGLELAQIGLKFAGSVPVRQMLAFTAGRLALDAGMLSQAATALREAEDLSFGALVTDANVALVSGTLAFLEHHHDKAYALLDEAVELAQRGGSPQTAWRGLARKANMQASRGVMPDAIRSMRRALRVLDQAGEADEYGAELQVMLGRFLLDAGAPGEALDPFTTVLNKYLTAEHAASAAGNAAGDVVGNAAGTGEPAADPADGSVDPAAIVEALQYVGEAAYRSEDYSQAYSAWQYALERAEQGNMLGAALGVGLRLARLLWQAGDSQSSATFALRAAALAEELGVPEAIVDAKTIAGMALRDADQMGPALENLNNALELAKRNDADGADSNTIEFLTAVIAEIERAAQ